MREMRQLLRSLPVFAGDLPGFDPAAAPESPGELFGSWLVAAVAAGVREPHAMTLSTVGADGMPSARVLICKNVEENGWQFAAHGRSPKGRELVRVPAAALTFYWPDVARQVRIRGAVVAEPAERGAADFLARPEGSRAEALVGRQSEPLTDPAEARMAGDEALRRVRAEPGLVVAEWTLYTLRAERAEFWQGDRERRHVRLRYSRRADGWDRVVLWP